MCFETDFTRKSQFSSNYWNPQFFLLLLLPSGSSFARGRPLILTTTKRAWKVCFECQRIKFQLKKGSHLFTVRAEGADPPSPSLRVSLTVKYLFFFHALPNQIHETVVFVGLAQSWLIIPFFLILWLDASLCKSLNGLCVSYSFFVLLMLCILFFLSYSYFAISCMKFITLSASGEWL